MPDVNTDWSAFETAFRSCTKCEAAGLIPAARPLTLISPKAKVYLVGQAPSRTDHETHGFYVGPAGEKLKGWLVSAGFAPDALGTTIYATAMTRCFPGRKLGMSTDRAPSRAEQILCSTWMDRELALLDIRLIIPFGAMSINRFLGAGPLTERIECLRLSRHPGCAPATLKWGIHVVEFARKQKPSRSRTRCHFQHPLHTPVTTC